MGKEKMSITPCELRSAGRQILICPGNLLPILPALLGTFEGKDDVIKKLKG